MRMLVPRLGIDCLLEENVSYNLLIELPELFSRIIRDIKNQKIGINGEELFIYYEKNVALNKFADIIIDPFTVDCNDKKILNRVYTELVEHISVNRYEEYTDLNSRLINFADIIIGDSSLNLISDDNVEINSILKLLNVKVMDNEESLVERIIDYLRLINSILNIQLVFFCNIKCYLSMEQYKDICEFCFYQKIYVINIEGNDPYCLDFEKIITIDNDLCVIDC